MSFLEEITFLSENLKFNPTMCYYRDQNGWHIKGINEVSFNEKASDWLFHLQNEDHLWFKKLNSGSHRMSLVTQGEIQKSMAIHGLLSEIEIADITNDKNHEILLGISKKVNFDPVDKKRLNIFRVEDNGIKAVWLGTRFLYDLQTYHVKAKDGINFLTTLEKDSINQTFDATYKWDEFGFALKEIKEKILNEYEEI
jgi:hypothetical protein